jgi:DNA processing protein
MTENLIYKIALSLIPGIGSITAKSLIAYTGSAEQVFKEKENALRQIPGVGSILATNIVRSEVMSRAGREVDFLEKNGVTALFYLDNDYPQRLLGCTDAPIILYVKGNPVLNGAKAISIVGTRHATEYGRNLADHFIAVLAERGYRILIVSGLAYGIDIQSHKSALRYALPTVAVLGHGLETVYPSMHTAIAREMVENNGGLVSDFLSYAPIDRTNFLRRNRIIAGLSDATIVVESAKKGGALVTADIANSYNRDVFAFPGKVGEPYSEGCHFLIKSNRASLIESVNDLEYVMNWSAAQSQPDAIQPCLFYDFNPDEKRIVDLLRSEGEMAIDLICIKTTLPMNKVSPTLLNLEFAGFVKGLPGKVFKVR